MAPWVVRLGVDNSFARNLFTRSDAMSHLWDKEPGIYLRSRGILDDIWSHFRKFTRVKHEQGKWFYFRFWDNDAQRAIVNAHKAGHSNVLRFFIDPRLKLRLRVYFPAEGAMLHV